MHSMSKTRKAIFMPEEVYEAIKKTAESNNRKIVDQLKNDYLSN